MPPARLPAPLLAAAVLLLATFAPAIASASVVRMDLGDLARSADAVVVAKVTSSAHRDATPGTAEKRASRGPSIVTDLDLKVTRVIAGDRPDNLELTQPGGAMDGLTLVVPELPTFVPGEQCVLFLDDQDRVIGGFQGKLRVKGGRIEGHDVTLAELAAAVGRHRGASSPEDWVLTVPLPSTGFSAVGPEAVGEPDGVGDGATAGSSAGTPTSEGVAGATAIAPAADGIASITPPKQIAGMGLSVTISGSGFGANRGNGTVEFTDGLSLPAGWRAGTVTSWTDTQIVVVVPASAASGPVRVTTDSGSTLQLTYDVGFSATGRKFTSLPVAYVINENTADMTGEGAEIQKAFATWNSAGSNFRLAHAGTTTRTEYPPATRTGANEIYFSAEPAGMLAVNYYWFDGSKRMLESDIIFNDDYTWAANASSSAWDVQTVALHELGHTVGLDDQYTNTYRVMGAGVWGQNKRVLTADEIAGAIYLYGAENIAPPAPAVSSSTHPNQATWYRSATTSVGFSAAGALSGYSYVVDGSATTTPDAVVETAVGSASFPTQEGDRWLHVRAVSTGGLAGAVTHFRLRSDLTPPSTSSNASATYDTPATVTLAATDALSGVRTTYASIDGGAYVAYTQPVTVSADGQHTIRYYSVDTAGNTEPVRTASFTIDLPEGTTPPPASVVRLAGSDRYAVAVNAAREAFPGWAGVTHVVIASGDDRAAADPLSAAGLAGAHDAPVLLVRNVLVNGKLPGPTETALAAIKAANGGSVSLHVVGGTTTIPSAVWNRLSTFKGPSGKIERIAGADRYALSAEIAKRVIAARGSANTPGVLIANGADSGAFYDALAASPIAFRTGRPLLLVQRGTVPNSVKSLLNGSLAGKPRVVVNGTGWISESVYAAVGAGARLSSTTERTTAAAQIASAAVTAGWLSAQKVAVANKLPDALTGGSAMGRLGGPLLYTGAASLSYPAETWLDARKATVTGVYVVGGTLSVSSAAFDDVGAALQ